MDDCRSLSHTVWDCKYNVAWIPKFRRKTLYKGLRRNLGEVFKVGQAKGERHIGGSTIHIGESLIPDPVRMLVSIPPKYGVVQAVGCIKGESAIHIARTFPGRKKPD